MAKSYALTACNMAYCNEQLNEAMRHKVDVENKTQRQAAREIEAETNGDVSAGRARQLYSRRQPVRCTTPVEITEAEKNFDAMMDAIHANVDEGRRMVLDIGSPESIDKLQHADKRRADLIVENRFLPPHLQDLVVLVASCEFTDTLKEIANYELKKCGGTEIDFTPHRCEHKKFIRKQWYLPFLEGHLNHLARECLLSKPARNRQANAGA